MTVHDEDPPDRALAQSLRMLDDVTARPPDQLKGRIVHRLQELGLTRRRRHPAWLSWAAAASIAAAAFFLGRASIGGMVASPAPDKRFILLLHGGTSPSEHERSARRLEYRDWMTQARSRGHMIDGAELADGGRSLPGPAAEGRVVGFFILTATNQAEAVALAETHPHLRHGGALTVAALR